VSDPTLLVPARQRGTEWLDDSALDPAIALRSLEDIRLTNRFFGGTSAVLAELRPILASGPRELALLDVGTGAGDIPAAARDLAKSLRVSLTTIGLDWTVPITRAATTRCGLGIAGDARRLPIASHSVDIVTCSQVLHHFDDADASALLKELHRVARVAVIIGDLRRSRVAALGVWLASWPLRFHHTSRHDGVVSVMRGFTTHELETIIAGATGVRPTVRRRPGFRVTATWRPA
jgi:SAM-dependent methyltransferase